MTQELSTVLGTGISALHKRKYLMSLHGQGEIQIKKKSLVQLFIELYQVSAFLSPEDRAANKANFRLLCGFIL